ncbi:MAG: BTAD domain-containing putative transcriptional regulator [Nitriliruptoraceae bacterium]
MEFRLLGQIGCNDPAVPDVLVRQGEGYALRIPPEWIDARRFEALADEVHDLLATGAMAQAADRGAAALALWTGEALEPLSHEPWARAEATRLEERRLATVEDRAAALGALIAAEAQTGRP